MLLIHHSGSFPKRAGMLKMTHFGPLFEPFLDTFYLTLMLPPWQKWQKGDPKMWPIFGQKWVISGSLARARARARGDKIDFVLEMPFWGFKMDYPKMTHFGSLFGPQIIGNRLMFWSKKWPKMGDFGCPGVPGQKWKNGSNLVLEWVARNDDPLQIPIVRGCSHFLVHEFWGSSRISSV